MVSRSKKTLYRSPAGIFVMAVTMNEKYYIEFSLIGDLHHINKQCRRPLHKR
ncbi:hypothetical protein HMPREF0880_00051 [Yokenella regensburgei ATCC 43003]|nr:hypothetical protein HMPREF0880_00051 [Yokenella regensburgei ATCC 43003]